MKPARPLINYFGAKWTCAEWIISHLPEHEIFVEVFGGSAAVLLQKDRSKREVVNDIDDEIVNLYRIVRDHGPRLKELCALTPHSRVEYERAREYTVDPIERARRTIVKSFFGIGDSLFQNNGFRMSKESNTCAAKSWENWWRALDLLIARFQGVLIESLDFQTVFEKYDTRGPCSTLTRPMSKTHAIRNTDTSMTS